VFRSVPDFGPMPGNPLCKYRQPRPNQPSTNTGIELSWNGINHDTPDITLGVFVDMRVKVPKPAVIAVVYGNDGNSVFACDIVNSLTIK